MKYTAKKICELLNIKRETLRYYENEGLIHPQIDENNHYRYYDDWDINYILEILKYRHRGFSIQDISKVFQDEDLSEYIARIEENNYEIEKKITYYKKLLKKNSAYLQSLKLIEARTNTYELVYSPAIYYLPVRYKYDTLFNEIVSRKLPQLLDMYEFVEDTLWIPFSDLKSKSESFFWALAILESDINMLNFDTADLTYFPQQLCFRTIIDASERWNFGYHMLDDAIQFIHHNGFEITNDIFGILLTRLHNKEQKYCRYIELYIPVKKICRNDI